MDCDPFRWDSSRRSWVKAELDAAYLHLYDITNSDAEHIIDSFPIVRKADEKKFGEYRTKGTVLEIFDEMKRAMDTGKPYKTRLDPPPGDIRATHEAEKKGSPGRRQVPT